MERRDDLIEFVDSILQCDLQLRAYIDRVESDLGKEIQFIPTASTSTTYVDWNRCLECCPIVWVNLNQLRSLSNPQALLAHEVTHIRLVLVEGYPRVRASVHPSESLGQVLTQMSSSLQDLVVEDRLINLGFDMSEDIQARLETVLDREQKGEPCEIEGVEENDQKLIDAFTHALYYLSRYTTPDQKERLSQAHKGERTLVWAYAEDIIRIVETTPSILRPEGQCRALKRLGQRFDLQNTYLIEVARNLSSFDEIG